MIRFIAATLLCLASVFLVSTQGSAEDITRVFVSIAPQKFFIQQICKEGVQVEVLVTPGSNPHTYEPKPSQMRKLAASRAYFAIGMPFENTWLDKFSDINPNLRIVHTDAGIEKLAMLDHHDDEEHQQGAGHAEEETGDGLDPHIWLSPSLVKQQARIMTDALGELLPDKATYFQENLAAFIREIDLLDAELRTLLQGKEGMRFMVFHPSWGYFAREYGLIQIAAEIEGKEPKPNQLQKLIEQAKEENIHVIFAQPQFSSKSARLLAEEINGEVVMIDNLAENWLQNMREVAAKMRSAVK